MPNVSCPFCEGVFDVDGDDLTVAARFHCDECGALLEVAEEKPLVLAVIEEEEDFDLDEDALDEDDDFM